MGERPICQVVYDSVGSCSGYCSKGRPERFGLFCRGRQRGIGVHYESLDRIVEGFKIGITVVIRPLIIGDILPNVLVAALSELAL